MGTKNKLFSTALFIFCSLIILANGRVNGSLITKCNQDGLFAMTFDDGPSKNIPQLLEILREQKVKVSFHFVPSFLSDPNVQKLVRQVAEAGHEVGIRSDPKWNLGKMSSEEIKDLFGKAAKNMSKFTGKKTRFARLPYPADDQKIIDAVESAGLFVTQANLDSQDSVSGATSDSIFEAFELELDSIGKGEGSFISVQRDMVAATIKATKRIVELIESRSYTLVTLDQCVGESEIIVKKKKSHKKSNKKSHKKDKEGKKKSQA